MTVCAGLDGVRLVWQSCCVCCCSWWWWWGWRWHSEAVSDPRIIDCCCVTAHDNQRTSVYERHVVVMRSCRPELRQSAYNTDRNSTPFCSCSDHALQSHSPGGASVDVFKRFSQQIPGVDWSKLCTSLIRRSQIDITQTIKTSIWKPRRNSTWKGKREWWRERDGRGERERESEKEIN